MTTKTKIPAFGDGPGTLRGDPQVIILVAVIQESGSFITEGSSWSCSSPGMSGLWDVAGVPTGCRNSLAGISEQKCLFSDALAMEKLECMQWY